MSENQKTINELRDQVKRWERERNAMDDLIDFTYKRIDELQEETESENVAV